MRKDRGFTIIELVIVITIMGMMVSLFIGKLSSINYWKEEGTLKKLSSTVAYLNTMAVIDQKFYIMEFDINGNQYRVGIVESNNRVDSKAPLMERELAAMISPYIGDSETIISPPDTPSLAEPIILPGEMKFTDIMTPRGKSYAGDNRENKPYLIFSPRGVSEFGVIHIMMGPEHPVTVLANPWTGLAEVYREYKEFEWKLK